MTPPTEDEVRAFLADWARLNDKLEADATFAHDKHTFATRAAKLRHALALLDEARKDRERLDWYEQQHKLHGAVEVLYVYVVDEYELTITHDGNPVRYVRAPTLRAAIDQARGA